VPFRSSAFIRGNVAGMGRTPIMLAQEHHSAVRFTHVGPLSRSGSRAGQRPIAREASSHRPGDPDAADLSPHRSNRVTIPRHGFDLRRGGLLSWGCSAEGTEGGA
jgi:hypothetical protein